VTAVRKVAVFGIAGFIGRHFESFIVRSGLFTAYEFHGFARDEKNAERSGQVEYHVGDALNDSSVAEFLKEVSPVYIVNLVGMFRTERFSDLLAANVGVSRAICEAIIRSGLKPEKILLIGSAAEIGAPAANPVSEDCPTQPVNLYGLSKLYQTLLAGYYFRVHALPIVVARTFNLLGKGISPILSVGAFMRQIDASPDNGRIKVGNLETSRDFIAIEDAVDQYWRLLITGRPGEIYNVCSGTPRTIRSVLEELIAQSGKRLTLETDPSLFKSQDVSVIYGDPTKYRKP
jgi:GDP-4-dehydro-6-deoxy-D-mannose reductase